jgi:hypothetical protein
VSGDDEFSTYEPQPIDTSGVSLPLYLRELSEALAENAHDVWAAQRLRDGWRYGPWRDDRSKRHPCLVPYDQLPESEKEYDRNMVDQTLRAILAREYRVVPADGCGDQIGNAAATPA